MRRTIAALALLGLIPGLAPALEIVNLRPAYGPHGATRKTDKVPKVLQGDLFWVEYAIEGLKVDEKTDKAVYETILEFFDATGSVPKRLFERKTPNEAIVHLGGNRMPGDLHVITGDSAPGKYTVKLTVKDKLAMKETSIVYPIEIVPPTLGFTQVGAPALALPASPYLAEFSIVGFARDDKQLPKVDVTMRVLDANDKQLTTPVKVSFPEAIPAGAAPKDLKFLPVNYPIFLNRPGQFTIDILAVDKNANNKQVQLRLPLTVLDVNAITSGK